MAYKSGWIRNPLTIIGIFSTLTEGLCIVILPQLDENNQNVFIWFVILFPTILLLLFFYTIIKHNTRLYAPGDFSEDKLDFARLFLNQKPQKTLDTKNVENNLKVELNVKDFIPFQFSDLEVYDSNSINAINNFFTKLDSALPKEKFEVIHYELHNTHTCTITFISSKEEPKKNRIKSFSILANLLGASEITVCGSGSKDNNLNSELNYILTTINNIF